MEEIKNEFSDQVEVVWWNIKDEDVIKLLEDRGFDTREFLNTIKGFKRNDSEDMDIEITGEFDTTLKRFAAKVLMNFACVRKGKAYVLNNRFNYIREFIRYGKEHPSIRTGFSIGKIDHFKKIGNSHFVGLLWGENYSSLYGIVSWYNSLKYTIRLGEAYGLINCPLPISTYNLDTKQITDYEETAVIKILDRKPKNDEIVF